MTRTIRIAAAVLSAAALAGLVAAPVGAQVKARTPEKSPSKPYTKCEMEAQACLDMMVEGYRGRGWVGIEFEPDVEAGVLRVKRVIAGSPAEAAGMLAGDELKTINGVRLMDPDTEEMRKQVRKTMVPGAIITYTAVRGGKEREVRVTLGTMPFEVIAQAIGYHMLEHASVPLENPETAKP